MLPPAGKADSGSAGVPIQDGAVDMKGLASLAVAFVALGAAAGTYLVVSGFADRAGRELPVTGTFSGRDHEIGLIDPARPIPPVSVTLDDGTRADLSDLVKGKWTIAQLMFTACSTTCPIQGAIFQRADKLIAATGDKLQMLSISIDAAGDDAASMDRWLTSFEASPRWRGVVPDVGDLTRLADVLKGGTSGVDIHDTRVYFIDPAGNLRYATEDMPPAEIIAELVAEALAGPPRG
jgi:protein SCO1/2